MKFFKRINKLTGIFFVIISFSIIYIFFSRAKFDYTSQLSYFQLYPPYNSINISSFKTINDSILEVHTMNPKPASGEWRIAIDSSAETLIHHGSYPAFTLKKGTHVYKIQETESQIEIEAEFIPKGKWDDKNFTEPNITILRSNLPSADNFAGLNKWQQHRFVLSEKEKQQVAKILKDSIHINNDDTISKAEKISRYLCSRIASSSGHMNDSIRALSVCSQYTSALNGSKIDCGAYSNIFSVFAQEAGVINRIVELKHNFGTFNSNIHIFNEYFDEQRNQWVATDIMLNHVNYKTADGTLLNGVQVKNFLKNSAVTVTQSLPFSDSIRSIPFDSLNPVFYSYYSIDKDLYYYYDFNSQDVYSFKEKAKRFFTKHPWYEVYSDTNVFSNRLFYLKQFLLILWLILLVTLLASGLVRRSS